MKQDAMLTILYDNNSSFSALSYEALNYLRDDLTFTLSANQILYIGFRKPINAIYAEIKTANSNINTMTIKFHNGTDWTGLADLKDDTKSFSRSGFINWVRDQVNEKETTINSIELFWYKIESVSSAITLNGLNLVFADDNDLKIEVPDILNERYLGVDESGNNKTSHILYHVAARNQIVQEIRNKGNKKIRLRNKDLTSLHDNTLTTLSTINQYDILDMGEIRQAATYLALSKIFFNLNDSEEDNFLIKSKYYQKKFESAFNLFYLSLDFDDDGLEDRSEKLKSTTVYMGR